MKRSVVEKLRCVCVCAEEARAGVMGLLAASP